MISKRVYLSCFSSNMNCGSVDDSYARINVRGNYQYD